MKSAVLKNEESAVRIVKVGHCPSLSGKSKLTYEIGSGGEDDIRVRVVGNSAAGAFNPDWVGLAAPMARSPAALRGAPV